MDVRSRIKSAYIRLSRHAGAGARAPDARASGLPRSACGRRERQETVQVDVTKRDSLPPMLRADIEHSALRVF